MYCCSCAWLFVGGDVCTVVHVLGCLLVVMYVLLMLHMCLVVGGGVCSAEVHCAVECR